jgi:4-diphosphocytidyl-2C-methyl-D-erythritol kinase
LADEIELRATDSGEVEVQMRLDEGLEGDVPEPRNDLTFLAAQQLIERGATNPGVRIEIVKRIPIGSGLGGGSGNAAGVLTGLKELWNVALEQTELVKLAYLVGSDVPYCLDGGTALAMDRGGELTPLPILRPMHIVLCLSFEPLSTKLVYESWDELGRAAQSSSAPMALALGAGDIEGVATLLHNDLERPAFGLRPELENKKQSLIDAGALGAGMSGSGPTLFAIARDADHSRELATRLRGDFDRVVTVTSVDRCIERHD